jgi:D-hexose-6-phosphate mutarotase
MWESEFELTYTIELSETELKTQLEVYNPRTEPFECNTLLHTYLRVNVCQVNKNADLRISMMSESPV